MLRVKDPSLLRDTDSSEKCKLSSEDATLPMIQNQVNKKTPPSLKLWKGRRSDAVRPL